MENSSANSFDEPVVLKSDAIAHGLLHYFTGKPCKNGHIAKRLVTGRGCTVCCKKRSEDFTARAIEKDPLYRRRRWLLEKYGLTLEDHDKLHETQRGLCAVCEIPLMDVIAHVDHCHSTGEVRGLLCGPCNQALGLVREDPKILNSMLGYLESSLESRRAGAFTR